MGIGGEINEEIGGTASRLHEQLDTSLVRAVDLHRTGASEEAVLAETAVAVGAAKALEILTGDSWEETLERKEEAVAAGPAPGDAPSEPKRWRRRNKDPRA